MKPAYRTESVREKNKTLLTGMACEVVDQIFSLMVYLWARVNMVRSFCFNGGLI